MSSTADRPDEAQPRDGDAADPPTRATGRARPGGVALEATLRRIERAAGGLAAESVARMDATLPWFRELSADRRSWVMLICQSGVNSFAAWTRDPAKPPEFGDEVFAGAPRELARSISLQHTVALIKVTIDVVEERVPELAAPGEESALAEALLRFSREVAFASARVYARAAESRGAWDARLQAMLVDALLRGEVGDAMASRAAALGWSDATPVAVAVGRSPAGDATSVLHGLHRTARRIGVEVLGGVHGNRLVAVLGGAPDPVAATAKLLEDFGDGPVVVGPAVPSLDEATESARAAIAGYRAAHTWPGAPRPVSAGDLLPERALAGDPEARRLLRTDVYGALQRAGDLLDTLDAFFAAGGVLESTARALYVHPNTVRYRLRRIADLTGFTATAPRDSFALRVALVVGRLDQAAPRPPLPAPALADGSTGGSTLPSASETGTDSDVPDGQATQLTAPPEDPRTANHAG
ncbi:PucR family transcriptional regulator [Actinocatenispora sera]|uniref:PucR family transcriptional regulator n=1 Tax=Actinocatenispora sera TaxID=390989 RepID=A0A810L757_9ACTN|nr:PucR family transcriptional regulator [Actinocatenispora sera]